jgi:hypothetical protein
LPINFGNQILKRDSNRKDFSIQAKLSKKVSVYGDLHSYPREIILRGERCLEIKPSPRYIIIPSYI